MLRVRIQRAKKEDAGKDKWLKAYEYDRFFQG